MILLKWTTKMKLIITKMETLSVKLDIKMVMNIEKVNLLLNIT